VPSWTHPLCSSARRLIVADEYLRDATERDFPAKKRPARGGGAASVLPKQGRETEKSRPNGGSFLMSLETD
jgi:hypothetical protein